MKKVSYKKKVTTLRDDNALWLSDGRRLDYAEYGAPDGEPIFLYHGNPRDLAQNSSLQVGIWTWFPQAARGRGGL